jgi:hypothetical protein
MRPTRWLSLSTLIIAASFGSVCGQERWQRLPPSRDAQFYAPRNSLEEFESRQQAILIKGQTWIGSLRGYNGGARVEATEIRDARNSTQAKGVTITISASENSTSTEVRCLIDESEIDPLVAALDTMGKASDAITRLAHFEVHYRTQGDFEVIVFKQTTGGIAAAIEGGFYDRTRMLLTLDDLSKLRWMIVQAKEKIDEIK